MDQEVLKRRHGDCRMFQKLLPFASNDRESDVYTNFHPWMHIFITSHSDVFILNVKMQNLFQK